MADLKNILYTTDFSEDSQNALTFALEVARINNATIHIMHSIEEPYDFAPMIDKFKNILAQRVDDLFNNMVADIRKDKKYDDINVKMQMQTGRALYTILEQTNNLEIDMIVMGAKGRTGLEKIFFGSTTAAVVQHSKVPVLTVPKEATFDGFKKIIFATDYQDEDIEALQFVTDLVKHFQTDIQVFHSSRENDLKTEIMFRGFREMVKETISHKIMDFEHDTTLPFFEAILDRITKKNVSLLVMTRYQQSFSLFEKKYSKKMSSHTIVPLLVLPAQKLKDDKTKQE